MFIPTQVAKDGKEPTVWSLDGTALKAQRRAETDPVEIVTAIVKRTTLPCIKSIFKLDYLLSERRKDIALLWKEKIQYPRGCPLLFCETKGRRP